MKRISDSTSIVASRESGRNRYEVCATLVADLEESSEQLVITLDSFARQVIQTGPDRILHPAWLPRGETIRHHVPLEEAKAEVAEIFTAWTKKVSKSIPSEFVI